MKISINSSLIKRNKIISQFVLYISIGLIALGILLTLSNPSSAQTFLVYLILIPAYLLMQINVVMMNKYGKSPRVDEIITQSLKGLDNKYSLFHYTTGISHLLVGPAGVWIIKPYHQVGEITYDESKKKYKQKGGGNVLSKFLTQDSIGDIQHETKTALHGLKRYFNKIGLENYPIPIAVNFFYNKEVEVQARNAPEFTIKNDKLKDLVRQKAKKTPISDSIIEKILKKLPETF